MRPKAEDTSRDTKLQALVEDLEAGGSPVLMREMSSLLQYSVVSLTVSGSQQ